GGGVTKWNKGQKMIQGKYKNQNLLDFIALRASEMVSFGVICAGFLFLYFTLFENYIVLAMASVFGYLLFAYIAITRCIKEAYYFYKDNDSCSIRFKIFIVSLFLVAGFIGVLAITGKPAFMTLFNK
ncbi:hypothetical protein, partial [Thorsellia anophelis]